MRVAFSLMRMGCKPQPASELTKRRVFVGEQEVHLTPIEFRLLCVLVHNAGFVVTHRQLLEKVWGASYIEHSHYLRIYMGQLRHKIESDPARLPDIC